MSRLFFLFSIVFSLFFNSFSWASSNTTTPTLHHKIGQLICIGFVGSSPQHGSIKHLQSYIQSGTIGGVVLYKKNISTYEKTRTLIQTLKSTPSPHPLLVAIDQEGGKVQRLRSENGFSSTPSHVDIGQYYSSSRAKELYSTMASQLSDLGFNVNFGTVVDLGHSKSIITQAKRTFSSHPSVVNRYAKVMIKAHRKHGVISALKHYPGHGSTSKDTHHHLADITASWRPIELYPYQTLIRQNLSDMIMVGHLYHKDIDSKYPASLSKNHITKILRDQLGYSGVVISDDLQMGAIDKHYSLEERVILAIKSGTDILLFANSIYTDNTIPDTIHTIVNTALDDGRLTRQMIDTAYNRVVRLKSQFRP